MSSLTTRLRWRAGAVAALSLTALPLAGCTGTPAPAAELAETPAATTTPRETASATPEPPLSPQASPTPTPSPPASEPLYYTLEGTWDRWEVRGIFCTMKDESFIGSPQDIFAEFQDPGFAFFRDGTVAVSGTKATVPESIKGFGGVGTWDFVIDLDGRPVAIGGHIDAGYRIKGVGPGSAREFSADLDIDVTPGYDPELAEYCA